MLKNQSVVLLASIVLSFLSPLFADDNQSANPENYIGKDRSINIAKGREYMAVTSDPMATQAANDVLAKDGTAADAAIAAQLVLGLTEPQSSGLGGGAFALYYDATTKILLSLDGRETAPKFVSERHFLKKSGEPMNFYDAVLDGRSVGVPGTPALLGLLHQKFGKHSMEKLITPAHTLAVNGFKPSEGLYLALKSDVGKLDKNNDTKTYFYENDIIINYKYASVLKKFAKEGYYIFYQSPISSNIINAVNKKNGILHQRDFDNYKVILREPVCDYFRDHKICSMGEPSSGAITMLQILKIIEHDPSWHNYIEASKLAFSDRNYYMADPDFINSPGIKLLDNKYIIKRRELLKQDKILDNPAHGEPSGWDKDLQHSNIGYEEDGTTHISIVDKFGNAISMTSTIENSFGSRIMANGYLLNNELTDFSFIPKKDGKLIANRIEGWKRPRSSMTPTIAFSKFDSSPMLIIGSAGGSRIIGHVTQRVIDILYNKKSLQESIESYHLLNRGGVTEAEGASNIVLDLMNMGHDVNITEIASGLNGIYIDPNTRDIIGVSDPRRIGTSMGN